MAPALEVWRLEVEWEPSDPSGAPPDAREAIIGGRFALASECEAFRVLAAWLRADGSTFALSTPRPCALVWFYYARSEPHALSLAARAEAVARASGLSLRRVAFGMGDD